MSDPHESDTMTLEDFAMKPGYGRLTGVAIACHAISDAYLLMHVGVGCKNKVTHLLAHDWEQHCNLRQGWTEVSDQDLIMGSSRRIGPYLRSWQSRMESAYIVVVSVTFVELTGEDVEGEIQRTVANVPVPVDLVPALGVDGEEFDGFASVSEAVLRRVDWSRRPERGQVSILGYFFDRYEGDHAGNLVQLAGLLKGLGARLGPVLCSGRTYAEHLEVSGSQLLVAFPYAHGTAAELPDEARAGRRVLKTDLPMGLAGTTRWLREVGDSLGVAPQRVEAYARQREDRARAPIAKMRGRWRHHRVGVFAEAPLAAGLCSMLLELGLQPVLVGLRGRSMGGEAELRAVLERNGLQLPDDAEVLEAPSLARLRDRAARLLRAGRVDGFLGSATELNPIRTLEPVPNAHPFALEIGFPCERFHALQQMPFMGYGGVVCLAQRLVELPRLWDRPPSAAATDLE